MQIDSVNFYWRNGAKKKILKLPSKVVYSYARGLLDMSVPYIPFRTGKLRRSSVSAGVRFMGDESWIGSYTEYAKRVWNMPANRTHWSEPGTTSKWYQIANKKHGDLIMYNALKKERLK